MGNKESLLSSDNSYNQEEALTVLSIEFRTHWPKFLEQNCIVAKDKYVPVKILIQAFTFYLKHSLDFVKAFDAYNAFAPSPFKSIDHFVHLSIYSLLKVHPDIELSSGFNSVRDDVKYTRRNMFDYMYFVDERTVIGLSVERFQKA